MDLVAILSAARPGDLLYDLENPEEQGWGLSEHLLAGIADALHILVWQGGERKRSTFPKPIPRPGVVDTDKRTFGDKPIEIEDMQERLDRRRAGQTAA